MKQKFWALYSGGKDSSTVAHYLDAQGKLEGVVHLDTGIHTPDIIPFLQEEASRQGWQLEIATTPKSYKSLVMKYGFPGAPMHTVFMLNLKGEALKVFTKKHKGEEIVLASGVRKGESDRRMVNVAVFDKFMGVPVIAPIADWTNQQVWEYVKEHDLKISPAYKFLHISGDCLCGAYAATSEAKMIEIFYPDLANEIHELEKEVKKVKPKYCVWGGGNGEGMGVAKSQNILCAECGIWNPTAPAQGGDEEI